MAWYKIKYDHLVDGKYTSIAKTKVEAYAKMKKILRRFPYVIITIYKETPKHKDGSRTWVRFERWTYVRDFKTQRMKYSQLSL